MSLARDVDALIDATNRLERTQLAEATNENLVNLAALKLTVTQLGAIVRDVEKRIVRQWPTRDVDGKKVADPITVDGVGVFERHAVMSRTKWDSEALRRHVLDTLLVNEDTGEIVDETPLDKVLHVWNLGAPRLTALKARGLDPDEFCDSQFDRYTISLIN